MEEADGVWAATDTGEKMRGQALFCGEDLLASFAADDGLKIADHCWIRMRAEDGAEKIMRGAEVGEPVAHGFIDGVFERAAAGIDGDDLGGEQAHARDVERLAGHVFGAHVNDTFEAEMRGNGGGSDAVLAGTGFGNDARLAHFQREQALPDGVIDFVRAGVQKSFALEIDARASEMRGQARSELQRRGATGKIFEQALQLRLKRCVGLRDFVGALELEEGNHQRFRNVAAAVGAEAPRGSSWRLENGAHG